MAFGIRQTACILSSLALTGCASHDLMVKRQAEAEAKIEHLIQADKKNTQRMNEFSMQIQSLDTQTRNSAAQITQLKTSLREIQTIKAEVAARGAQAVTPKIEIVNEEPIAKSKESGPPAEYVKAFGLYSANNFSAAIEAFEAFIHHSPKSDYVTNAIYWIGECHYSLSDLPKSLKTFQKIVDSYPNSTKAPDAMLKVGYTQAAMKERDKSLKTFEELIRRYPSSPAAAKARERLTAN
jgi:tol-pal system protein YbgF